MTTHIICNIGSNDSYRPSVAEPDRCAHVVINNDTVDTHIRTNMKALLAEYGAQPPHLCMDLLHLAITVFTADTRVPRSYGHDGWERDFELHVPVSDSALWTSSTNRIANLLSFLTGDRWGFHFRSKHTRRRRSRHPAESVDAVSLFSGGLDSFIGAVEKINELDSLALVSHYGDGSVSRPQGEVLSSLEMGAGATGTVLHPYRFFVAPPNAITGEVEHTMRSRSFIFLALGVAVANSYSDTTPLVVPENGFISLNVPLTKPRQGSLSTRTTHPHFITLFREMLGGLGLSTPIELPYRFQTKGEMVELVENDDIFIDGWAKTMSCAHPAANRWSGGSSSEHCGYCFPCLIRRASLYAAGLDEPSQYALDVISSPPRIGTKKAEDLHALEIGVARFRGMPFQKALFEVLKSGPIQDESKEYVDVFQRGIGELRSFLQQ